RALGDAAHLLDIGRIEALDLRHQPLGPMLQLLPVDAVLEQRLRIQFYAAAQPVGRRLAVRAAAFARRAGEADQGKRGIVHQGLPSRAWRKRSFRCAPSCGGITKSSFSTITFTSRKTGPFLRRRSATSCATSLSARTVPLSAMPQPSAIMARSVPAPELVGPLLRGL